MDPGYEFFDLAVDPTDPNAAYAASYLGGVFKTTDGGRTWAPASSGLTSSTWELAIDPTDPSRIYLGAGDGVYETTDGAAHWTLVGDIPLVKSLAMAPSDPNVLYAGTGTLGGGYAEVHRSTDGGATWTLVLSTPGTFGGTSIEALAVDPTDPDTAYVGVYDPYEKRGVAKTTDGGLTWTWMNEGLKPLHVDSFAIDPTDPQTIYAGGSFGVYVSHDGAAHWTWMSEGLSSRGVEDLSLDQAPGSRLFAGTEGGGVFDFEMG